MEAPEIASPAVSTLASAIERTACGWFRCPETFVRTKRNRKYCSGACRAADYDHHHPRLATPPVIPAGRSIDRIVEVAADGRWRTLPELAHETGTREATVARRVQESQSGRPGRALARFTWDVRVRLHSKAKEYRLILNPLQDRS